MKNLFYYLQILTVLSCLACNKTISPDEPIITRYDILLLVPCTNNKILGINPNNGTKLWECNIKGDFKNQEIAYAHDTAYIANNDSTLYAINTQNGKVVWQMQFTWPMGHATTTVNNKILIISTQEIDWGSYDDSIYAIDVNTRQIIAKDFMGRYSSSGTHIGDNVFFAPDYDLIIKYHIPSNTFIRGAVGQFPCNNCIFLPNNIMYLSEKENGNIVKIDISNFTNSWNLNAYALPNAVPNSSTLVGGMLIVADNSGQLHCLNEDLKYVRWIFKTPAPIYSSAIIDSTTDNVFVGCNDWNMYAINYVNGKQRWKYPTAGIIKASPVLYNHNIYFTSYDKYLYCVNVHTGKLTWKYNLNCIANTEISILANNKIYYPSTSGSVN